MTAFSKMNAFSKRFPSLRAALMGKLNDALFPMGVPRPSAHRDVFDLIASLAPDPQIIFEVGASNGRHTRVIIKRFPAAYLTCFEANSDWSDNWPIGLTGGPTLVWSAVADFCGVTSFHVNVERDTGSLLQALRGVDSEIDRYMQEREVRQVPVVTLDHYVGEHDIDQIDILKMDIQGVELAALQGAQNLLAKRAITLIYMEVSFVPMYQGSPLFSDIEQYLRPFGYRSYGLYNLAFGTNCKLLYADAIFLRG